MQVRILAFDAQSPHFEAAVAVYSEYAPGHVDFHRHFFVEHTQRPQFMGLIAEVESQIVGVSFGSRCVPGQWWYDNVAAQVGTAHPALQNAFELTQLNVLAAYRNAGIGGLLHDTLLARQANPQALLSTQVANRGAQRFYKGRGWQILHPGFAFSKHDEPYAILHKVLRKC